jgi:hypothetical protein
MISTVTATTISAVTTVALAASFGLIVVITLLSLLIQKELVTTADTPRAKALNRALNVAIVPLLMAFLMLAVVRIVTVFG